MTGPSYRVSFWRFELPYLLVVVVVTVASLAAAVYGGEAIAIAVLAAVHGGLWWFLLRNLVVTAELADDLVLRTPLRTGRLPIAEAAISQSLVGWWYRIYRNGRLTAWMLPGTNDADVLADLLAAAQGR